MFILFGLDLMECTIENGGEFGFNARLYFLGDAVGGEIRRHVNMTEPGAVDVFIEIGAGFYARVGFRYVRLRCKEGLFLMTSTDPPPGLH